MTMKIPSRKNPKRMFSVAGLEGIPFYEKHEEHILILGAISVQWSTMERLLFETFRFLIHLDRESAETIFYALPSHKMRRDLVRNLVGRLAKNETNRKSLLKTLDQIKEIANRRNQLIHDTWMRDTVRGSLHRQKAGRVSEGQDDIFDEPIEPLIEFHKRMMRLNEGFAMAPIALLTEHRQVNPTGNGRKVR